MAKLSSTRTTDTQWRHKSKKSENLGRCGRQNMVRSYLKIWDWELIFDSAVNAISSPDVRGPCLQSRVSVTFKTWLWQSYILLLLIWIGWTYLPKPVPMSPIVTGAPELLLGLVLGTKAVINYEVPNVCCDARFLHLFFCCRQLTQIQKKTL